jgi:protein tyrosine/serine phosphatase
MMIPRFHLSRRRAAWLLATVFAATLTVAFTFSSSSARQALRPPDPAERITLKGVSNAAQVNSTLYRGAQPSLDALPELKKLGIGVIVDFRDDANSIGWEKKGVESQGMTFVSIPWSASKDPSREKVIAFFTTLNENSGKKIFVHCERGADRTGTMIALYRIAYDHWTPNQAVAEMSAFHYWNHIFPNLARYVEAFPTTLANDPSLTGQTVPASQH